MARFALFESALACHSRFLSSSGIFLDPSLMFAASDCRSDLSVVAKLESKAERLTEVLALAWTHLADKTHEHVHDRSVVSG